MHARSLYLQRDGATTIKKQDKSIVSRLEAAAAAVVFLLRSVEKTLTA